MNVEIIVAIISLLGSGIGTFGGILVTNKLVNYRLEQLEKKVDKHNQAIERIYKLEQKDAVIDETFKNVNHRLKNLESGR